MAKKWAWISRARIDWLMPCQASLTRILIPACEKTGIDLSRLCASFVDTASTSSGSIPLLPDQLVRGGRVRPGDCALLAACPGSATRAGEGPRRRLKRRPSRAIAATSRDLAT